MTEDWFYTDAGDHDIPVIATPNIIIGFDHIPKEDFLTYANELVSYLELEDLPYVEEESVLWDFIDWYDPDTQEMTPGTAWGVTYIERF